MLARLRQWNEGTGFPAIRTDWIGRAHAPGRALLVRLHDRAIRGRFESLDETGRLLLRTDDGTLERISAGDVFPLASAEADRIERTE
jgi:BirA family biotin operon repressor/biotin-[acetyl-CoA-carboxylase] ligase